MEGSATVPLEATSELENNMEMQSSRNGSVASSDTLTYMFDMATENADA